MINIIILNSELDFLVLMYNIFRDLGYIFYISLIIYQLYFYFAQIFTNSKKLLNLQKYFGVTSIISFTLNFIIREEFYIFHLLIFLFLLIFNLVLTYIIKPKNVPEIEIEKPEFENYKKGKIKLGEVFYNGDAIKKFFLNIEDIKRHMIIYGQTGTGKTTFVKHFLKSFHKNWNNIPFLLFEFKGEYNELDEEINNVKVIKPGTNFAFDIFDNDIFEKKIYTEVLFDSLKSCQIIENNADFSPQMEKILIDILQQVCIVENDHSWDDLFKKLDDYSLKNEKKIPQISQTVISIKNRLRRYSSGALKNLFNFSKNADKISQLLGQNTVIDLGNILKLGGSKEDVIFFANLILKWIWENNMKNEATDSLKHLTIFEDASYIASKKLLELSKLSSYLEDIALLLRGKGEALITLTTTLDISKNIVLNSGSKFFFKYNEKSEDVVHYIGINKNSRFNVNNLSIGYCIAKIDSIAKPFLLKCETKKKYYFSRNFKKKKPELIHFDTNKELGKIQDEKTIISPREIDPKKNTPDKNYYEEIVPDSSQKISGLNFDFKKAFENLEEFYLINEFSNCAKFIIQIYSEIINLECKEPKLNFENKEKYFLKVLSNKIKWNIQHMMKFIKIFHSIKQKFENNNSTYTSEEIQECIHRLKTLYKIFIKTNQLNNYNKNIQQHINYDNTDKKINQVESEIVQIPINLIVYFFNEIIGPEEFYFIGKTKILDKKQEILTKYMDFGVGLYETIYDSYHYLISTFELSSNWARGGHELVQIVIYLRQNQSSQQILASISKELISLTEKIKPNKEIFQGLYISRLKAHTNFKNEIIHQNFILKAKLKQFHSKLNTLKFGELTRNDNIEENFDSNYIKLVNLINSLIIKEQN